MADVNCPNKLTAGILRNCVVKTGAGIEANIVFINRSDIDRTATTFDPTNPMLITNLALKPGMTGLLVTGIKTSHSGSSEMVKKTYDNRYKHTFSGVMFDVSPETKMRIKEIGDGAQIVAVIELRSKGVDNESAFHVLGFNQGLSADTNTWNTAENDGMVMFTLANEDDYEEPDFPYSLLETDYATTKTAFDNLFVGPTP